MARPFSIPAIPALAVGEYAIVRGNERAGVGRKVAGYANRCKPPKQFDVQHTLEHPDLPPITRVTRLPDPEPQP